MKSAAEAGAKVPSIDLVDEWLTSRYGQVLESTDWTGTRGRSTIETQAAHQSSTDTVTLTIGSATVTGIGTAWATSIVGLTLFRLSDVAVYAVTARSSTTSLTLDRTYEGNGIDAPGTVYTGAGYVLMQNIYPLPTDCRAVEVILDAETGFPLVQFTPAEMDASAGPRNTVEDPQCFAMQDDTPEPASTPLGNTIRQIEFYPPPKMARGYTLEYVRDPLTFNGTNLAQSPLPFVSQSVLLFGVRADIAVWQEKLRAAQMYEAKFQEELKRLLMVEHGQRRAAPKFGMGSRYTRHRFERASRGFSNGWRGGGPGGPN